MRMKQTVVGQTSAISYMEYACRYRRNHHGHDLKIVTKGPYIINWKSCQVKVVIIVPDKVVKNDP